MIKQVWASMGEGQTEAITLMNILIGIVVEVISSVATAERHVGAL